MKTEEQSECVVTDVCILSYARPWTLAQCIAAIRQNTPDNEYRLHIAGDNPPDFVMSLLPDNTTLYRHTHRVRCGEGRRMMLNALPHAERIAYIDDDLTVTKGWLGRMNQFMDEAGASVVAANIISDANGCESRAFINLCGLRKVQDGTVKAFPYMHTGPAKMCHGGATLYQANALRATEYRPVFCAGYEDWDQTLQISDEGGLIVGSDVTMIHLHGAESFAGEYFSHRWQWGDLLTGALEIWRRYGIISGVTNSYSLTVRNGETLPGRLLEDCRNAILEFSHEDRMKDSAEEIRCGIAASDAELEEKQ